MMPTDPHSEAETLHAAAGNAELNRLAASNRRKLLFVTHDWGGGVEKHVQELTDLVSGRDCDVLLLKPVRDVEHTVSLSWANGAETLHAFFALEDWERLLRLFRALRVERMHLHHIHELPRAVMQLPAALGIPYDCTLHDYYPVCPQYQLVTSDGRYCGEPDERGCRACLLHRPARWGLDIVAWRKQFGDFLSGASRVIVPSQDMAKRLRRYFPALELLVWPHPEASIVAPPPGRRPQLGTLKILVLGGLSPSKGLRIVEGCAADAQERQLPLHFRLLGHTSAPIARKPEVPFSLSGQYRESELRSLIELERAHGFLFPAQVPETHSYTLSIAMQTGLPIFASDLGALPERLSRYGDGHLIAWNAAPRQWNDLILETLRGTEQRRAAAGTARSDTGSY
jgi:glycosyltransferase involved in cell wall biosynthesis